MRVAVCAADMEERYALLRLVDDALLRRGFLAELTLFPLLAELLAAEEREAFDLVLLRESRDAGALQRLCGAAPVILVGGRLDGPSAFDAGARYFMETPVDQDKLDRALRAVLTRKERGQ